MVDLVKNSNGARFGVNKNYGAGRKEKSQRAVDELGAGASVGAREACSEIRGRNGRVRRVLNRKLEVSLFASVLD